MVPTQLPLGTPNRNALAAPLQQSARPVPSGRSAPPNLQALLASTIGHAALLSDTPEKWASTVAMLRKSGVDPEGYVDFEKGRPAAVHAAGVSMPETEAE